MLKDDLKCVLIGRNVNIYSELARLVKKIDATSRFKQVDASKSAIKSILKKVQGPSLIFISDEVSFSLELLSDLIWQYHADAIVVIVTTKAQTVPVKELFNNTQFSRIKLDKNNSETNSVLNLLIKSVRKESEFRRCKSLLGVSERRCQWLVDSSREAVAFISRDMHWYANVAYLNLFGIDSVQKLRSITVKDLIMSDEHQLFDVFKHNQAKSADIKHSILLSMKRLNGSKFRAKVYLIPSVFKGQKCYQLWIQENNRKVDVDDRVKLKQSNNIQNNSKDSDNTNLVSDTFTSEDKNPFSDLFKNTALSKNEEMLSSKVKNKNGQLKQKFNVNSSQEANQYTYDANSLLKGVIRRKEARIIAKPLNDIKYKKAKLKNTIKHQVLSLSVAAAQKKGVDDLLVNLPDYYNDQKRSIFWEKVKFSRLLQILIQRNELEINLLVRVHEASIVDDSFIDWLLPGLERLGEKSKNLTFLIPSNIDESQHKKALSFIRELRKLNCKIALDSFSTNKQTLVLLKHSSPDYVRLSLPWTKQIHGNDTKEIRLSSVIRKLEANNIQVIAPCGYSKDMRRLFALSGTSFCQ